MASGPRSGESELEPPRFTRLPEHDALRNEDASAMDLNDMTPPGQALTVSRMLRPGDASLAPPCDAPTMSPARLLAAWSVIVGGVSLVGCNGGSTGTTPQDAGNDAVAPAHCSIDPVFPPRDGGTGGSCRAARYSLACSASGSVSATGSDGAPEGVTASCISDDPARCDNTGSIETSACVSQCAANEYGAACGSPIGDAGTTQPPPTCRSTGVGPGGHSDFCCTCE